MRVKNSFSCILGLISRVWPMHFFCLYRVNHGNLTLFEWVVLSRYRLEEQTVPICGFNKMVPQRTVQTSQWLLFKTCFPGTSFPVSEPCRGPLALPFFQRVIFFLWGYLKSRVYPYKPRTSNDLKESIRQEIRPIDRQLLARVMDD
jgi:hypothetical protein